MCIDVSTSCRCNIQNDTLWILKTWNQRTNEQTKRQNTETKWTEKKVPAATQQRLAAFNFGASKFHKRIYMHTLSLYVSYSRYRLSIQIAFISFTSLYVRWHDECVCVCSWFDSVALHHYQVSILSICTPFICFIHNPLQYTVCTTHTSLLFVCLRW